MSAFDINPTNYLGHDYAIYVSTLQELALSKPAEYFKLRRQMVTAVKSKLATSFFQDINSILKTGKMESGSKEHIWNGNPTGATLQPKYPSQKVADLCLSATATLDGILEEVCEILMPSSLTRVLGEKLNATGQSNLVVAAQKD
jgi:hypothetical protein